MLRLSLSASTQAEIFPDDAGHFCYLKIYNLGFQMGFLEAEFLDRISRNRMISGEH